MGGKHLWEENNFKNMLTFVEYFSITSSLIVNMLKNKLVGDIEEIYAYFEKISPCIDCRYCWQEKGCAIKDTMDKF